MKEGVCNPNSCPGMCSSSSIQTKPQYRFTIRLLTDPTISVEGFIGNQYHFAGKLLPKYNCLASKCFKCGSFCRRYIFTYTLFSDSVSFLSAGFLPSEAKHAYSTRLTSIKWLSDVFIHPGARGLTEWPFSKPGTRVYCERLVLCTAAVRWGPWWLSAGLPAAALSDFLSFALPAALRVLEALIGPELDCGRPDYWCQRAPAHVGTLERPVPSLGSLTAKRGRGVIRLSVLVTQSVNTTCLHTQSA